jgi:hypothetical protein
MRVGENPNATAGPGSRQDAGSKRRALAKTNALRREL